MRIEITSNGKMTDLEAKLRLTYKRMRKDYQKVLQSINDGNSILNEFPNSIANSIKERLLKLKFVDSGMNLTENGNAMLESPELSESEVGVFSMKMIQFNLGDNVHYLIPEINRELSIIKRNLVEQRIQGFETHHQINLGNEIVRFISVKQQGQSKNVFIKDEDEDFTLKIDLINKSYIYGSKSLDIGSSLGTKIDLFVESSMHNNPYGDYDVENHKFILRNGLSNLSFEEITANKISRYQLNELLIEDVSFIIDDEKTAYEYLYKVAYFKLQQDSYYSIDDLNDIYDNEIFNSGVFTPHLQSIIYDFRYEMNGFSVHLPNDEYQGMQYKLNVLNLLLGFSLTKDNNDFANSKDFKQLVKTFRNSVSPKQVEECYIVMGYPFAKNSRNQFPEFYEELSKFYDDVSIIKKGNKQKEDKAMIQSFKEKEVPIYEIDSLREHYHDRYIIFKQKNNQYKVYLVTSEIGQFFKSGSNDKMGLIKELDYNEIKRSNQSNNLIKIIERGIKNA